VEEAISFRFPNKMPPGYRDARKEPPLRAAGDYILWRQIVDRAQTTSGPHQPILLITNDLKDDWWALDTKKRKPQGPRPELVQELRDNAGSDFFLLNLADFLTSAKQHLASIVSDQTLEEVRQTTPEIDDLVPSAFRESATPPNLLELSPRDFERLILYLLVRMGYDSERVSAPAADARVDFVLSDNRQAVASRVVVEAKRLMGSVPLAVLEHVYLAMLDLRADRGLIFTTSSFSRAAYYFAQDKRIDLIDGVETLRLLLEHAGLEARIDGNHRDPP
jgi:hypothetical protein